MGIAGYIHHIDDSPMSNSANLPSPPLNPTQQLSQSSRYIYLNEKRHKTSATPSLHHPLRNTPLHDWRTRERLKTVSVALLLCLNIGVDPPDIVKTNPCAKLEAWVDPFSLPPRKALEAIGKNLQQQFEVWQPRARYKLSLDPSVEETKKLCCSLRRNAKEERILFYYNGHGVPKPTPSGELWVFNKNYTQYIPVSIYDLQTWLGAPCIYVYDCSAAGNIMMSFNKFADQRDAEAAKAATALIQQQQQSGQIPNGVTPVLPITTFRDSIQLAACGPNEILPMNPDLPADIFTACLTTPIEMSLRWFVLHNPLLNKKVTLDLVSKVPGRLNDRRTPLGELNWIFTAITDTIAWNVLSRDLFKRLFRQDLMVAALFRNFLLADRVMRSYRCNPMSEPLLPSTSQHPLWNAWDLALDQCLAQLPALVATDSNGSEPALEYRNSTFFAEQLTAFEVWLSHGTVAKKPPEQLPIVLQVLLSQVHRLRALILLSKFLDLGSWAVDQALSVGIFPYVLKLLQSPAPELKPVLVFIWARILAVDPTCQSDLLKDNGFAYFIHVLSPSANLPPLPNVSEHRAMCAFILSTFCYAFRAGQQCCLKNSVIPLCVIHLSDVDPLLRQWSSICIGQLCADYPEAKFATLRDNIHEQLVSLLSDPVPEVRASAVFTLGKLFGDLEKSEQLLMIEHYIVLSLLPLTSDASPIVRKELVISLSYFVNQYAEQFVKSVQHLLSEESDRKTSTENQRKLQQRLAALNPENREPLNLYHGAWKVLLILSVDPHQQVAELAKIVADDVVRRYVISNTHESSEKNLKSIGKGIDGHGRRENGRDYAQLRHQVAIRSDFFEWSREYFAEPQMRPPEDEEPGSVADIERTYRHSRNDEILDNSQSYAKQISPALPYSDQLCTLLHDASTKLIRFHSYDPYLLVADTRNVVTVWDWKYGTRVHGFRNLNCEGSRITSLELLNEDDVGLVCVGSDDGTLRIYRNYAPLYESSTLQETHTEIVTTWRPLTELTNIRKGFGLLTEWQQATGCLITSGDARSIKVWDLEREFCIQEIHTRSSGSVTSLSTDSSESNILLAGTSDGVVRVYDKRLAPKDNMVSNFKEHKSWLVGLCVQKGDKRRIISGSANGDIRLWDLRLAKSVRTIDGFPSGMTTLSVHNHVPSVAA
ncbi:raptor N-terminal caspase like domain-containing protein [Paraphysoderma sedebokerense]|nr:raptor N-terminal caspase like domain-containing protein [Paraphysoderma sedebokerense]